MDGRGPSVGDVGFIYLFFRLAQLQPGNAAVHFVFNDTSEQQVLSQQMPSTTYTGNSDPNLV